MKSKSILGLAIGSSSVKLLELSKRDQKYCVEHYAIAPIEHSVTAAIEDALVLSGTKIRAAAIAMPDTEIISKIIPMDTSLTPDEIEARILTDIHQYIHYPLNEICLDFEIIDSQSVLLIAARAEQINTRIALANQAGITVNIVDVHSHAIERASTFITKKTEDITALIDVGKNNITIMILDKNKIIFSRTEPLSTPDAVLIQIERAFHFFYSSEKAGKITQILLMGGGSYIPELTIPTTIANPFLNMAISEKIDPITFNNDARLMITACGLALRSFDHESH